MIVLAAASTPILIASVPTVSIAKIPPELRVIVVPDENDVDVTELVTIVPAESNSIARALTSTLADASLPIVIVFATACVPKLIAAVPTVSIDKIPWELNVNPEFVWVNDTSSFAPNDNTVLSFCNLILLRTILSWGEFNTFVFT